VRELLSKRWSRLAWTMMARRKPKSSAGHASPNSQSDDFGSAKTFLYDNICLTQYEEVVE
jgi:hypothetical protein